MNVCLGELPTPIKMIAGLLTIIGMVQSLINASPNNIAKSLSSSFTRQMDAVSGKWDADARETNARAAVLERQAAQPVAPPNPPVSEPSPEIKNEVVESPPTPDSIVAASVSLTALDTTIQTFMYRAYHALNDEEYRRLEYDQVGWRAERSGCVTSTIPHKCMEELYYARVADLDKRLAYTYRIAPRPQPPRLLSSSAMPSSQGYTCYTAYFPPNEREINLVLRNRTAFNAARLRNAIRSTYGVTHMREMVSTDGRCERIRISLADNVNVADVLSSLEPRLETIGTISH